MRPMALSQSNPNLDTITAMITPTGPGAVAIVRVSGEQAIPALQTLTQKPLPPARYMANRTVYTAAGNPIDDACVVVFRGPASFTGEDVVEWHIHASPVVIQTLRAELYGLGIREAKPGEFTKRAFLNGKLDLTQAEGIGALIEAESNWAHQSALNHVQGSLHQWITRIRTDLLRLLEVVDGHLDFPDEIPPLDPVETLATLQHLRTALHDVVQTQDHGEHIQRSIRCLIVGQPNVGKSSLFNALLGHNRAIVTRIPGTTRDYITATTQLGGYQFEWTDSAGIRQTRNQIEAAGIRNIKPLMAAADILVWVQDQSKPTTQADTQLMQTLKRTQKPVWRLLNKSDLKTRRIRLSGFPDSWPVLPLSTRTPDGLDALKHHITQTFQPPKQAELALLCNARQRACLTQLLACLTQLHTTVTQGLDMDLLAFDLKAAIHHCSEMTGEAITETVLDGIFSRFCVGK